MSDPPESTLCPSLSLNFTKRKLFANISKHFHAMKRGRHVPNVPLLYLDKY